MLNTHTPPTTEDIRAAALDRYRGCLLGLAIGDALGMPIEFHARGSYNVSGMEDGVVPAGYWTDDTSMAICLAESIITRQGVHPSGWDPDHQASLYVKWFREGYNSSVDHCFDIGGTTSTALQAYEKMIEDLEHTEDLNPFCGPTNEMASGNGSLMRLAPVPMAYAFDDNLKRYAAESSRTTHGSDHCVASCEVYASLLATVLRGDFEGPVARGTKILSMSAEMEKPRATKEVENVTNGSYMSKRENEFPTSFTAFVVHSLEGSLWANWKHDNFQDVVLAAVNLGIDNDTTGAIAGQLAGALYGESGIPKEWIEQLHEADRIRDLADKLFDIGWKDSNELTKEHNIYHIHLDTCGQCKNQPFDQCPTGQKLLEQAAASGEVGPEVRK